MSKNKKQGFILFLIIVAIIILIVWLTKSLFITREAEYNLPEEVKQAGQVQAKVNPESSLPTAEEIKVEDLRGMLDEF